VSVTGPLAETVETASGLKAGNPAAKTATAGGASAPLFDLTAYAGKSVLVSVNGGAQQTVTFPSATFGGAPVAASTVAAAFSVAGLQVTANDGAGTIQFDTVRLGAASSVKFDDGPQANGLHAALGSQAGSPKWNFHKYLIGRDGKVAGAFPSAIEPLDRRLTQAIEKLL
jgi:hypothetical protein